MKFTEESIQKNNVGLYVIKDNKYTQTINEENANYCATVSFKLIYMHTPNSNNYGMCNFLTDGWCYYVGNKQQLVEHLNNEDTPYRILSKEDLLKMLNLKRNQAQLFG
jgi:hypothetical protein